MTSNSNFIRVPDSAVDADDGQIIEPVQYDFGLRRRTFVQLIGAGLLVAVGPGAALAQRRGERGGNESRPVAARIVLGKDGIITVLTGKVECGQGARTELTQAAAEELRAPASQIRLVMADTSRVPDDGMTVGSRTTPSTVPAVRQGAAAARELFAAFACKRWNVERSSVELKDGKALHAPSRRSLSYADFASDTETETAFQQPIPSDVALTPLEEWTVLGTSLPHPNSRSIVTGTHQYPSDIRRPGMLYGKVLRPPSYGANLTSVDLTPATAMPDVVAIRDGELVGVAAKSAFLAGQALDAVAATAKWETAPHPSSKELSDYLKRNADGGIPANPFADTIAKANKSVRATYEVAYAQHAPLEPRAAVAEWAGESLTVWTATQRPQGVQSELARAFRIAEDRVRLIVPDFGGGFGGKHTGECAVEAARLARAAGRPVSLCWTREEEFTWAAFRPAAVIEVEAALDEEGALTAWHFVNVNSGGAGIESPYRIPQSRSRYVRSEAPLRHGSYRALAATANNFARESFMDELAAAAGRDPLEFRLACLDHPRLRAVLEAAAERFDWKGRIRSKTPNTGIGLACGTEKGSYVAACAEVTVDPDRKEISVRRVCQTFECGPILNPANLLSQVEGAIIMGLGPALSEEVRFENGEMITTSFGRYGVPRFADVPELDIHLLNRPDLPPVGAGETPIIAVAPAIANAVFHACGQRIRTMPIRLA